MYLVLTVIEKINKKTGVSSYISLQIFRVQVLIFLHYTFLTHSQSHCTSMVNTNYYIENKLANSNKRSVGTSNMWHQNQKPGRIIDNRSQKEFIQRQIKRESETTFGNCIKQISKECKDMLKKKL